MLVLQKRMILACSAIFWLILLSFLLPVLQCRICKIFCDWTFQYWNSLFWNWYTISHVGVLRPFRSLNTFKTPKSIEMLLTFLWIKEWDECLILSECLTAFLIKRIPPKLWNSARKPWQTILGEFSKKQALHKFITLYAWDKQSKKLNTN